MYPGYEVRLKFYWTTTWTTPSPRLSSSASERTSLAIDYHIPHTSHTTLSHTHYTPSHTTLDTPCTTRWDGRGLHTTLISEAPVYSLGPSSQPTIHILIPSKPTSTLTATGHVPSRVGYEGDILWLINAITQFLSHLVVVWRSLPRPQYVAASPCLTLHRRTDQALTSDLCPVLFISQCTISKNRTPCPSRRHTRMRTK